MSDCLISADSRVFNGRKINPIFQGAEFSNWRRGSQVKLRCVLRVDPTKVEARSTKDAFAELPNAPEADAPEVNVWPTIARSTNLPKNSPI